MVEKLLCHGLWLDFLEYKVSKKLLSPKEEQYLREYIENKKYVSVARRVVSGEFHFSVPLHIL